MFPVISLFSGAGGFDIGLEQAGLETVVCVEKDRQACLTLHYNSRWPVLDYDITQTPTQWILEEAGLAVGDAFLVVGGPPCQGFSMAGRQDPSDPRNKLFWEFVRVVEDTQPWGFVMENVPGLLSMKTDDGYPVVETVLQAFEALGYTVQVWKLDAADHGAAQHRKRVLFVGNRDGLVIPKPIRRNALSVREALLGLKPDAPNHTQPAGKPATKMDDPVWVKKHPPLNLDRPSATVMANQKSGVFNLMPDPEAASGYRRATVRELARLQGFPDTWEFIGSETSQYRQVGNAVPVQLGFALGEVMKTAALTSGLSWPS